MDKSSHKSTRERPCQLQSDCNLDLDSSVINTPQNRTFWGQEGLECSKMPQRKGRFWGLGVGGWGAVVSRQFSVVSSDYNVDAGFDLCYRLLTL